MSNTWSTREALCDLRAGRIPRKGQRGLASEMGLGPGDYRTSHALGKTGGEELMEERERVLGRPAETRRGEM